jgi:glycosyltransferase involved in cell wall biosynthesis
MKNKPRVAWVTNLLAHYRAPCFQELHNQIPGQITFFFLAESMGTRGYIQANEVTNLPAIYLRGWKWSRPRSLFLHDYDDLHLNDLRPILKGQYDILVLSGWDEPSYLLLWTWGIASRKKVLFWCESTQYDTVRLRAKEAFKRLLLKGVVGCITAGNRAQQYCHQLGMPDSRIFIAPNATDRSYFRGMAKQLLPMKEAIKKEAGLHGMVILFVGRLEEAHKSVSTLIRACGALEKEGRQFSLVLAGDGRDKERYEALALKEGLTAVQFPGMLGREALCRYYAIADVLVLPSRSEPWGFVLNEAMEFGLPLVVSEAVGAGPDLVLSGKNGFVVPVGDAEALAGVLKHLQEDESLRRRMGETSRLVIENFAPSYWCEGVLRALEAAGLKAN